MQMQFGIWFAPVDPTNNQSGQYPVYDKGFWYRVPNGMDRGPGAPYQRQGYGISWQNFLCSEIGIEKILDDGVRAGSLTVEDLEMKDTAFVTQLMELKLEKQAAAAFFVTGVWSTDKVPATKWDAAMSTPIKDIRAGMQGIRKKLGKMPNKLILGDATWAVLQDHTDFTDRIKYSQTGIVTTQLVAELFGFDEVVIGGAVEVTSAEGIDTEVDADLWGDNVLLLCQEPMGLGVTSAAATFVWPGGMQGANPWAVQQYREETVRSNVMRAFTYRDMKVLVKDAGYLLNNVLT